MKNILKFILLCCIFVFIFLAFLFFLNSKLKVEVVDEYEIFRREKEIHNKKILEFSSNSEDILLLIDYCNSLVDKYGKDDYLLVPTVILKNDNVIEAKYLNIFSLRDEVNDGIKEYKNNLEKIYFYINNNKNNNYIIDYEYDEYNYIRVINIVE